ACSGHNLELARLDYESHIAIIKTEMLSRKHKLNSTALAGAKRDALESAQLFYWSCAARRHIAYVKLHDLVACAPPRVFNFDADGDLSTGANPLRAQLQIRELELSVTQPI